MNASHSLPADRNESENIHFSKIEIGDIVYVSLDENDGLILTNGYKTRKKYIVIVGFTKEGVALGSLLINSNIDISKRSPELLDCQYPLLRRHYPDILTYDSWVDCSDIFELSLSKMANRDGSIKGSLTEDDKERILLFLKETDVIDNITKRRFGLI